MIRRCLLIGIASLALKMVLVAGGCGSVYHRTLEEMPRTPGNLLSRRVGEAATMFDAAGQQTPRALRTLDSLADALPREVEKQLNRFREEVEWTDEIAWEVAKRLASIHDVARPFFDSDDAAALDADRWRTRLDVLTSQLAGVSSRYSALAESLESHLEVLEQEATDTLPARARFAAAALRPDAILLERDLERVAAEAAAFSRELKRRPPLPHRPRTGPYWH